MTPPAQCAYCVSDVWLAISTVISVYSTNWLVGVVATVSVFTVRWEAVFNYFLLESHSSKVSAGIDCVSRLVVTGETFK